MSNDGDRILTIHLTEDERNALMKPAPGDGGFENLIRALQDMIEASELRVSRRHAERLVSYTENYGPGGWQKRCASVTEKVKAELAKIDAAE